MKPDIKEITIQIEWHQIWIETLGEQGDKLGIDEVDLRNMNLSH